MALVLENFQTDADSNSKSRSLWAIKLLNLQTQGGGELLKVQKKRIDKVNALERKTKQAMELLKLVLKKRNGNVNIKEGKPKPKTKTESKRTCICAPTTHEGSFKCRFHRIRTIKTGHGSR